MPLRGLDYPPRDSKETDMANIDTITGKNWERLDNSKTPLPFGSTVVVHTPSGPQPATIGPGGSIWSK